MAMADEKHSTQIVAVHSDGGVDYDKRDPQYGLVALVSTVIIVAVILVIGGVQFVYERAHEKQVHDQQLVPVAGDLQTLRSREDGELHSYRVVDKDKGVVRIPIERAMELMEKEFAEGAPKYPTVATPVKKPDTPGAAPATPGAAPAAQGTPNVASMPKLAGAAN